VPAKRKEEEILPHPHHDLNLNAILYYTEWIVRRKTVITYFNYCQTK
jgi:hypothetical protein